MAASALRVAIPIGACLGWAAGCAASPQLSPVAVTPGCYAVTADDWPTAVVEETGLSTLPSFIGLDTAVAGPRGRRVIVPTTWKSADPTPHSAFWTNELHGNRPASLVLTFVGPRGDFVASLEESREGYTGDGVALGRRGANRMPQVQVSLAAITCSGLRLGAEAPAP